MEQYKPEKRFSSVFYENSHPSVLYLYNIFGEKTDVLRAMHAHPDTIEVMYVKAGRGVYLIGSKRYIVSAGDLIVINANVLHEESLGEASLQLYSMGIVNLRLKGLPPNTILQEGQSPVLRSSANTQFCGQIMEMIYRLNAEKQAGRDESCYYLLRSLVSILYSSEKTAEREKAETGQGGVLAESVCMYINANYEKPLTLQILAELFHVNKYYLSHVFREHMNVTVTEFILHRRIGEAQSELLETDYPIAQISDRVGFSSVGYFNRQFKKLVHMTPMEYRRTKDYK